MKIGSREFDTADHTYVCGILNVTPDSFSDGGRYSDPQRALEHARQMIWEGAALIDIGGESTRPGYQGVTAEEERKRILPVITALRRESDIPISVDTVKAEVAEAALDAGADLVNDISCLADPAMPELLARRKCPYCLTHNRAVGEYDDLLKDVVSDLKTALCRLEQAGVQSGQIILDPGIGFAKSYEQNLELLRHPEILTGLGYPVLLGISRKSVIGLTLGLPAEERLAGTLALDVYGALHGCSFLRVHDVAEHVQAVRMLEALRRPEDGGERQESVSE